MTALLYTILSAALYYLFARAQITSWLWSRYPSWLDSLTWCAACSGFWYGIAIGGVGWWQDWRFLDIPGTWPGTPLLVGLWCLVTTPLAAAVQVAALERLDRSPAAEDR